MVLLSAHMDEELYKENILDRYKHPRNKNAPEKYDIHEGGANATCGDALIVFLSFDENAKITEAHWDGEGCAVTHRQDDGTSWKNRGRRNTGNARYHDRAVTREVRLFIYEHVAPLAWRTAVWADIIKKFLISNF
jgi:hypothetical protein